jgi:hypothetical protein
MQLADEAEAIAIDGGLQDYFVYYDWMEDEDITDNVTQVRIDSSAKVINDNDWFSSCVQDK